MSLICGDNCPLEISKAHALEMSSGLNDHEFSVVRGLPTIAEKADKAVETSFDNDMTAQSCEISCRALRAMIYTRSVGGLAPDVLRLMSATGQEI